MRLLNVRTLTFSEFSEPTPPYAIASHRWVNDETTYLDLLNGTNSTSVGYKKVLGFCEFVKSVSLRSSNGKYEHLDWIWIDSCCIDRRNSAELSEAVISMRNWYTLASLCIVYLQDVRSLDSGMSAVLLDFERSDWLKRGWTLQELIFPKRLVFTTRAWEIFGTKGSFLIDRFVSNPCGLMTRCDGHQEERIQLLQQLTRIPSEILSGAHPVSYASDDQRWSWLARRDTTRPEDIAYCMLGIFGVSLDARYGEGGLEARQRLETAIKKKRSCHRSNSPSRHVDIQHISSYAGTGLHSPTYPYPNELNMEHHPVHSTSSDARVLGNATDRANLAQVTYTFGISKIIVPESVDNCSCPSKAVNHGRGSPIQTDVPSFFHVDQGGTVRPAMHETILAGFEEFSAYTVFYRKGRIVGMPYDVVMVLQDNDDVDSKEAPDDEGHTGQDKAQQGDKQHFTEALSFSDGPVERPGTICASLGQKHKELALDYAEQSCLNHFLPDRYHGTSDSSNLDPDSGLAGPLPLLIGLAALSQYPHLWQYTLPLTIGSRWKLSEFQARNYPRGEYWRSPLGARGVVVTVYLDPSQDSAERLQDYEKGLYGPIIPCV